MAALTYRDDKILARNLLLCRFFCLTPAEPFFRPDRSSTAPSCRVAVKDGRAFRGHPKGLSLTAASTMARWRYRSGRRPCVGSRARLVTTAHADHRGFPLPLPAVSTEVRELQSGSPSIISISRPSNCLLLLSSSSDFGGSSTWRTCLRRPRAGRMGRTDRRRNRYFLDCAISHSSRWSEEGISPLLHKAKKTGSRACQ